MSVLAVAEHRSGALRGGALETVTAARELADALDEEVVALLVGPPALSDEAENLARHGADRVLFTGDEGLVGYSPEGYATAVTVATEREGPRAVLFAATAQGKDLAPRVAARLRAGLATEATEVGVEDERIVAVRPVYAGKAYLKVAFRNDPALISIRPRTYQAEEAPRDLKLERLAVEVNEPRTKVSAAAEEEKERPDVAEAEIVVSGGRGMQGPQNWHLLEDLADALGSAAGLGASRAVVDSGWRPHSEQVGQTGKVVAPPLYFAVGISGAIQHQAGMKTAKCIVAINKDPQAPIFKIADYGIVGDLFEIVPRLTEEIRKLRSKE
jgi:electron transfer flavoprotein alpha subunit